MLLPCRKCSERGLAEDPKRNGSCLTATECGEELFFSLPNKEAGLTVLIDGNYLRRIFQVFNCNERRGSYSSAFPVFTDNANGTVAADIVGAGYRETQGRSWPCLRL